MFSNNSIKLFRSELLHKPSQDKQNHGHMRIIKRLFGKCSFSVSLK